MTPSSLLNHKFATINLSITAKIQETFTTAQISGIKEKRKKSEKLKKISMKER